MQFPRTDQMPDVIRQPSQEIRLMNIRLPQLPVEPQHQILRRPALDVDIEGELFGFARELIGDVIAPFLLGPRMEPPSPSLFKQQHTTVNIIRHRLDDLT
jgi:hypothetical protein